MALALAVFPLGAAACGGSHKSASTAGASTAAAATPTVRAAVRKTVKAGSEHVAVSARVTAAGQNVAVTGAGDFDSKQRIGTLKATLSLGGVQTSVDEVLSADAVYVSSPLFSALLPAGKTWLKIDLGSAGKALGVDLSVLAAQDPSAALSQLEAIEKVRALGTQTIGGVQTTHYRGKVDVAKLPSATASALGRTGVSLGAYDVWVGDDGYVHRVKVTMSSTTGGQSARTTLTTTLSDFGETVQVSVPPASDTVDASKVNLPGIGG